ncbi:MAG: CheR family methyltransferase [Ignavibacteria bacterium]
MATILSEDKFHDISKYISDNLGLYFQIEQQNDLERGLKAAMTEFGHHNLKDFVNFLLNSTPDKEYINEIAIRLTIGETYFFRENRIFEILREKILPEIFRQKDSVRFWSAGCCSGEESYSIAMMMDEYFNGDAKGRVTIQGTDINPEFLTKAARGIYNEWSFRNVNNRIKAKYFTPVENNKYELNHRIRTMVSFSQLNLMDGSFPSQLNGAEKMDIIFCRNVLLYFNADGAKKVAGDFAESLNEGGWLISGMSELSHTSSPRFRSVNFDDAILFQLKPKDIADKVPPVTLSGGLSQLTLKPSDYIPPSVHRAERIKKGISARRGTLKNEVSKQPATYGNNFSLNSAKSLYESGDYEGASKQFEHLFNAGGLLKSELDESYLLTAKSFANTGRLDEARKWCAQGLSANKLNAALHLFLGILFQEENKTEQAIEAIGRAVFLNQDYIAAHFALGNIYRRNKNCADSRRHFKIILEVLEGFVETEIVADTDGMTAGRMKSIVLSSLM